MLENLFARRAMFWAVLVALFAVQIAIRMSSEVNHDAAWYLYVAQGLADGKAMYRDFMEVNPPLAAWETLPLAWIADATGLAMPAVFNTALFSLTGLTLALSNRSLARIPGFTPPLRRLALLLIAAALLFFPGANFGQREHILILLFLPWLLLRAARMSGAAAGAGEAAAIGLLAALGICLKPHALLAPLMVEAALIVWRRNGRGLFSLENAIAGLATLAYGAAIWLMTPDFFIVMLPLGIKAYVPFIGLDRASIVIGSVGTVGALIMSGALNLLAPAGNRPLAVVLLAAAGGFLLSYFVQAKGFGYQLLPGQICAALAGLAILPETAIDGARAGFSRALAIPLAALLIAANIHDQRYLYLSDGFDEVIAREKPQAKSLFIATTNLSLAFPLVTRGHYRWGSRFPAQWLTPYLSTVWKQGSLPPDGIAVRALDWAVTDLTSVKPDVVIVDTSNDQAYVPGGSFDYIGFWSQDARFASFWQDYELRRTVMDFAVYVRR